MKNFTTILIFIVCFTNILNAQWTEQTLGTNLQIYSVSAVDDNTVWACGSGGRVLRTTNSGINWSLSYPFGFQGIATNIQGIDSLTALVAIFDSHDRVFKTIDGGITWTYTISVGDFITSIKLINGFPVCVLLGTPVGGRWTQFLSFDFGSTWDSTGFYIPAIPGEYGSSLWSSAPTSPTSFFLLYGTNNSKVYKMFSDGSFLSYTTPGLQNSYTIWGNDNSRIMAGGQIMLYSTNGGVNWTNVNAIGSGTIWGICGADDNWYYVRGSSVYKSTNNGTDWINDYSATGNYTAISLSPMGRYLWAVRENGGISRYEFNPVLPVELLSFTSSVDLRDVSLNWSTITEEHNSGFEIERSPSTDLINGDWSKVGFVSGNGTSEEQSNYSFTDKGLNTGKFYYRLKQIDFNGNFKYYNLGNEVVVGVPDKYRLAQNYPNPFNPVTKINYEIPFDGKINLKVFDMSGREIYIIVNEVKTAGYHTVSFNASGLSSGAYYYTINAEGNGNTFTATKKMMLVK